MEPTVCLYRRNFPITLTATGINGEMGNSGPALFVGNFPMHDDQTDIFTIDELARYLKISKSTLYKLAQDGRVPGQKVGRHWRFRKATIDAWLAKTDSTSNKGENLAE